MYTSLFAALDVRAGTVIGKLLPPPRCRRVSAVPRRDRRQRPTRPRRPPGSRQLGHPQDQADSGLAGEAAALPRSLHAHLGQLDQPGRALVRPLDRARAAPRRPPLRRRPRACHPRLCRGHQRRPEALPLGEVGRRHPRQRQALLPAHPRRNHTQRSFGRNFRTRTLAILINASFDVALEGPMQGIWFWCLVGFGSVMVYLAQPIEARQP